MDIFADVLAANMLTAMFIFGAVLATRQEKGGNDPSWLAYLFMGFPVAMLVLALLVTEPLPPSLDAIAAQQ